MVQSAAELRGQKRKALAVALGRCVLRLDGVREGGHDAMGGLHPNERATRPGAIGSGTCSA